MNTEKAKAEKRKKNCNETIEYEGEYSQFGYIKYAKMEVLIETMQTLTTFGLKPYERRKCTSNYYIIWFYFSFLLRSLSFCVRS